MFFAWTHQQDIENHITTPCSKCSSVENGVLKPWHYCTSTINRLGLFGPHFCSTIHNKLCRAKWRNSALATCRSCESKFNNNSGKFVLYTFIVAMFVALYVGFTTILTFSRWKEHVISNEIELGCICDTIRCSWCMLNKHKYSDRTVSLR